MTNGSATPTTTDLLHRITSKDLTRRCAAAAEIADVAPSLSPERRKLLREALVAVRSEEADPEARRAQDKSIGRIAV